MRSVLLLIYINMIPLFNDLQWKIQLVENKYSDNNTIILIDNRLKDFFKENILKWTPLVTKNTHYKTWTPNIMESFWWIPIKFSDDIWFDLSHLIIKYWKIILFRHKYHFEVVDKEEFLEFLQMQSILTNNKSISWQL